MMEERKLPGAASKNRERAHGRNEGMPLVAVTARMGARQGFKEILECFVRRPCGFLVSAVAVRASKPVRLRSSGNSNSGRLQGHCKNGGVVSTQPSCGYKIVSYISPAPATGGGGEDRMPIK